MWSAHGVNEFHRHQITGVEVELLLDADGWPALDFPHARAFHTRGQVEVSVCVTPVVQHRVTVLETPDLATLCTALGHARALLRAASGTPTQRETL